MSEPALIQAVKNNNYNDCEILIKYGEDIDILDNEKQRTPLFIASKEGYLEICKLLISKRANVNYKKQDGMTPLYVAQQNGHSSVCDLLIKHGAEINYQMKNEIIGLCVAKKCNIQKMQDENNMNGININLERLKQQNIEKQKDTLKNFIEKDEEVKQLIRGKYPQDTQKGLNILIQKYRTHQQAFDLIYNGNYKDLLNKHQLVQMIWLSAYDCSETVKSMSLLSLKLHDQQDKNQEYILQHQKILDQATIENEKFNLEKDKDVYLRKIDLIISDMQQEKYINGFINQQHGDKQNLNLFKTDFQNTINTKIKILDTMIKSISNQKRSIGAFKYFQQIPECAGQIAQGTTSGVVKGLLGTDEIDNTCWKKILPNFQHQGLMELSLFLKLLYIQNNNIPSVAVIPGTSYLLYKIKENIWHIERITDVEFKIIEQLQKEEKKLEFDEERMKKELENQKYQEWVQKSEQLQKEEKQFQINEKKNLLITACVQGDIEICKYLIERGADVNIKTEYGYTPLIAACEKKNIEVCKYLIEKGADVNIKTEYGKTPLITACSFGNIELCKYLISKGADVNIKTDWNETPLIVACKSENVKVCTLLIEKGADVNIKTAGFDSTTPLIAACKSGNVKVCKLLIEKGADVNHQDKDGETALYIASQYDQNTICELLIKNGATVDHQEKDGGSSLYDATYNGDKEMIDEKKKRVREQEHGRKKRTALKKILIQIKNNIENDKNFGSMNNFYETIEIKISTLRNKIEELLGRKDFMMFFRDDLLKEGNKTLRQIGYIEEGIIELEKG